MADSISAKMRRGAGGLSYRRTPFCIEQFGNVLYQGWVYHFLNLFICQLFSELINILEDNVLRRLHICPFFCPTNCSKPLKIQFFMMQDQEMQQTLTFESLELSNNCHFCLKNDLNKNSCRTMFCLASRQIVEVLLPIKCQTFMTLKSDWM